MKEIDPVAKFDVTRRYALPDSLHIPIAAKDKAAITRFVGDIVLDLSDYGSHKAFLISVEEPTILNNKLSIWKVATSHILHKSLQVWVHIGYNKYRQAYKKAFPDEDVSLFVLDHIMSRRIGKVRGFQYVRIVPISRSANSSSGALAEKWGFEYHSSEHMQKVNKEKQLFIQYADMSDIVKMLDINIGGGFMDVLNDSQKLLLEDL